MTGRRSNVKNGYAIRTIVGEDRGTNSVLIFRNTSSGNISFAAGVPYVTAAGPRNVALGDFNNDGKLDIAITTQDANQISVLKNNSTAGSVNFAAKVDFLTDSFPTGITVSDCQQENQL